MASKRKIHTAAFKAQGALAALIGDRMVNELAGQFSVHPTLIHTWKKRLFGGADRVFANRAPGANQAAETLQAELYEQISQLNMELEWVKKSCRPRLTRCGRWSGLRRSWTRQRIPSSWTCPSWERRGRHGCCGSGRVRRLRRGRAVS